MYEGKRDNSSP